MKTTFDKLESGTRFHYNVDADGHEPHLYKISDAEAYVEQGSGQGLRETISPETEVWTWSEPVVIHSAPTEIERAALTILMGGSGPRADHVGLRQYILTLVSDPEERRSLDEYIWESTVELSDGNEVALRQFCHDAGYVCWATQWDRDADAFGAILDHKPRGRYPMTQTERRMALVDDAAARLADAIVSYRTAGRPEGDQTHTVMGMGAPLLRVTTSLAAAVAEYHDAMLNLYAGEQMDLLSLLNETTPNDLISQAEAAALAGITPQAINNAIRENRLRAYAKPDAVSHRPGDRLVSRAVVEQLWPR